MSMDGLIPNISALLDEIQKSIFNKALEFRKAMTTNVETFDEFKTVLQEKGGFISAHWDGFSGTEEKIKELTKATIRLIPLEDDGESGKCILTGKPSKRRVIFAVAY